MDIAHYVDSYYVDSAPRPRMLGCCTLVSPFHLNHIHQDGLRICPGSQVITTKRDEIKARSSAGPVPASLSS